MTQRIDKDSLPLNQPRRTPSHPTKSHVVKTKVDGKEKLIRFGEQGASTAGKPKAGESDRMTAKRASFKSRHAKNIAKGPASAAYWADKVKWADGGSVRLNYAEGDSVRVTPQNATLGSIAEFLKQSYSPERTQQMQGIMEFMGMPAVARTVERMSYGQPLTNINKANVPLLPEDTAEAAMVIGPMAGPLGRVAKTAGKAGARVVGQELNRALLDSSGPLARLVPEAVKPMYVVKPKGGNWLSGQPERITVSAKQYEDPEAVTTWIDKKLGSYVRNEMGTPEDPLRAMAEKWATEKPELLAQADAKLAKLNAKTRELMQERGVPEEFLTRHRQDVIAAEKARDLIEARQALHTSTAPAHGGGRWEPEALAGKRTGAGFPAKGMGVSEEAKAWEQFADEAIGVAPAGRRFGEGWGGGTLAENKWLAKVPPETSTYTGYGINELRLDHLGDELRNALNPNSGLPAELLLKYEDLSKKTVPDIVNRVADINAWRAAQKTEADLARANNAAVFTYKEYPEQGLAWKQIKQPGEESIPDETLIRLMRERDMTPDEIQAAMADPQMKRNIARDALDDGDTGALADALRYEGDTMKHCVGGYCPDIASGKSQIFSLRDERGRPHVTIETKPGDFSKAFGSLTPEEQTAVRKVAGSFASDEDLLSAMKQDVPEKANIPESITQIKGLENGPPDEKYLPQIQDFIKSGNWSSVDDLKHSGLVDISAFPKRVEALGSRYVTEPELNQYLESFPDKPGFAAGGYVSYDPLRADEIMNSINAPRNYAQGGSVNAYDSGRVDAILNQFM